MMAMVFVSFSLHSCPRTHSDSTSGHAPPASWPFLYRQRLAFTMWQGTLVISNYRTPRPYLLILIQHTASRWAGLQVGARSAEKLPSCPRLLSSRPRKSCLRVGRLFVFWCVCFSKTMLVRTTCGRRQLCLNLTLKGELAGIGEYSLSPTSWLFTIDAGL